MNLYSALKCDTGNVLYVLVLWKQPSFKQTSETVRAKRRITQIIAQWVPCSWASNSKCPTPIRAENVSRHNEVMTPGRTKMSKTCIVQSCLLFVGEQLFVSGVSLQSSPQM